MDEKLKNKDWYVKHQKWLLNRNSGERANLSGANLSGANLRWANLRWANLSEANLSEANLSEANLRGADLRGADLRGADLRWANLRWANLSEANLSEANLSEANLSEANLRGADLRGADLRGADLREANLREANLRNTKGITPVSASGYTGIVHASGFSIGCETESFTLLKKALIGIQKVGEDNNATADEIAIVKYIMKKVWGKGAINRLHWSEKR